MSLPSEYYQPQCKLSAAWTRNEFLVWAGALVTVAMLPALIFLGPVARSDGHPLLAQIVYLAFSPFCHQIPERSFYLFNYPLPVCARCLGIYTSLAATVSVYPLFGAPGFLEPPRRLWLIVGAAPLCLDFALGYLGIWPNTHISRFLTGGMFGAVSAFYLVPGLIELFQKPLRYHYLEELIT